MGQLESERAQLMRVRAALTLLVHVLRGDNHARARRYQVHRTAHPLDKLARYEVVGHVAVGGYLHCAQDSHLTVRTANHRKRLVRREERGPVLLCHSLLAGVNQIAIFLRRPPPRETTT